MAVMGIIGTAIAMIVGLMAIPTLIGCFGLLKRRPWARILMIILAILDIAIALAIIKAEAAYWPMIGIALAVYTLWVLLSKEGARLFQNPSPADTQPQTPSSPQSPRPTTASPPHPRRTLLICLIIAPILVVVGTLIIRAMPRLLGSDPGLPGQPLSFNLELPSEKIGQFDFPAGKPDHLTCKTDGFTISEQGASALELTPEQVDRINEILRTAYAEYTELERKHSQFKTSANSLSVVVSPFRQEAADFLDKLWTEIDAAFDQSKESIIHEHLPLGRIFGTFGFGKYKISINISKRADRFAYSVSWHHTEGPGPMGQLASISSDSSRTLPFDLHRFWNAEFQTTDATPPPARSESSTEKAKPPEMPYGKAEDLIYEPNGPAITDQCAFVIGLDPSQHKQVNTLIRNAYRRYLEIEAQHTRQRTIENGIISVISPFNEQARNIVRQLWTEIDAAIDDDKRPALHNRLPVGRIFGKMRFGTPTVTIKITKTQPGNTYLHTITCQSPGGIIDESPPGVSDVLPVHLQRFWKEPQPDK